MSVIGSLRALDLGAMTGRSRPVPVIRESEAQRSLGVGGCRVRGLLIPVLGTGSDFYFVDLVVFLGV